jgi:hypothetical protein
MNMENARMTYIVKRREYDIINLTILLILQNMRIIYYSLHACVSLVNLTCDEGLIYKLSIRSRDI